MPKKVLCAFPPTMLEQIDFVAEQEHRTRSDLIREALRRYLENFKRTQGQRYTPLTPPPIEAPFNVTLSHPADEPSS